MVEASRLPLVTIITPSFNQAAYLRATIESVLGQDYPHLEYMIFDGGSTDGSVELIREYESRLAYWVSESDAGQSDAINKGWRRAQGDVVAYLNSDDTYNPGAVRRAVEAFFAHPEAGLVHGDCAWIDQEGRRVGLIQANPFSLPDLLLQNRVAQPATFVRRTALDRVGLLDPSLHYLMDYDLWIRIALHFPFARAPRALANFRIHPASKTATHSRAFLDEHLQILSRAFADPVLPRSLVSLRERAMNYAYVMHGANAYALGQAEDGQVILRELFLTQPSALDYPDDIVQLFSNHALHVASLAPESSDPARLYDPAQWVESVLRELPPEAAALRKLQSRILAQLHLTCAFDAWQHHRPGSARVHVWNALRLNPQLARERGTTALLLRSLLAAFSARPLAAS